MSGWRKRQVLEMALEALETKGEHHPRVYQAITAIKEVLAQPEQEPVEWGVDWGKDGNSVSIIKRLADGNIEVLAWEYAPHPPQRTWVGLTDEEFEDIELGCRSTPFGKIEAMKKVEAKLKEKQ